MKKLRGPRGWSKTKQTNPPSYPEPYALKTDRPLVVRILPKKGFPNQYIREVLFKIRICIGSVHKFVDFKKVPPVYIDLETLFSVGF